MLQSLITMQCIHPGEIVKSCCSTKDPLLVHSLWSPLEISTLCGSVTQGCCASQIDRNLTWAGHLKELRNSFVKKLNLLKKCSFLKRKHFLTYTLKWPSLQWHTASLSGGTVTTWTTLNPCKHCTVVLEVKVNFKLPRDTPSIQVMELTQWDPIYSDRV